MAETAVSELRAFSLAERSSYQMNIFSVYKSFTEIYIDRTIRGSIKMQCSDIKSEVAYKVGKRDPLERKDIPATAVKMHIDVAEIMKQNNRYDTEQEQQETPEQTALPGITEEPETGDLQEKHEAKEEDEEENALSRALDFMSILLKDE